MEEEEVGIDNESVAVRSLLVAGIWFIGLALARLSYFMFQGGEPARALPGLAALFCGQGFASELLGFRCDPGGISFPRRVFPGIGFPTFWRRSIPARKISRVDALGERAALLYLTSTERVELVFPDGHGRRVFLRYLSEIMEARRQGRRQGHRRSQEA